MQNTTIPKYMCETCKEAGSAFESQCFRCLCRGVVPELCYQCSIQADSQGCYGCITNPRVPGPDAHVACVACSYAMGVSNFCYSCIFGTNSSTYANTCPMCASLPNPGLCVSCLMQQATEPQDCAYFGPPPPPLNGVAPFLTTQDCVDAGLDRKGCQVCYNAGASLRLPCWTCMFNQNETANNCLNCLQKPTETQAQACLECLRTPAGISACDTCTQIADPDVMASCIDCSANPVIVDKKIQQSCVACIYLDPRTHADCISCLKAKPGVNFACVQCASAYNETNVGTPLDKMAPCFDCLLNDIFDDSQQWACTGLGR